MTSPILIPLSQLSVMMSQSRLGSWVFLQVRWMLLQGCGAGAHGCEVTVPRTRVQDLGQDTQTGAGRGDSSEGLQQGPQLHLRWVTSAPHP